MLFQQYAAESVITAKYQDEVKKKDREIEFLRATMKKQEVSQNFEVLNYAFKLP